MGDETITGADCRELRELIHMLTGGCYLKKSEFESIFVPAIRAAGRIVGEAERRK